MGTDHLQLRGPANTATTPADVCGGVARECRPQTTKQSARNLPVSRGYYCGSEMAPANTKASLCAHIQLEVLAIQVRNDPGLRKNKASLYLEGLLNVMF